MQNIPLTDATVQVDSTRETIGEDGKNGFVHSGTSPTTQQREICQRCGELRLIVRAIPIYCVEGRLEFAPLCATCEMGVSR